MWKIDFYSLQGYDRLGNWRDQMKMRRKRKEEEGREGREGSEMEWSRGKTSLGKVLGERLEQVFCHDSALVYEIIVEVYLEI